MIHIWADILVCGGVLIPVAASTGLWCSRLGVALDREQRLRQSAVDASLRDRERLGHMQDRVDRAVLEAARARKDRDAASCALGLAQDGYDRLLADPLIRQREAMRTGQVKRGERGRIVGRVA